MTKNAALKPASVAVPAVAANERTEGINVADQVARPRKFHKPPYGAPHGGLRWRWHEVRAAHDRPHKVMAALGTEFCGNWGPPCDNLGLKITPNPESEPDYQRVYYVHEDASSLWIGYPDEWRWHMSRREARRVAWFILWRWWARGEWFGLRRWAWYKALFATCNRNRRAR